MLIISQSCEEQEKGYGKIGGNGMSNKTNGQALIQIETYNNGVGTRVRYVPKNISTHIVISVLEMLLRKIRAQTDKSGEQVEWKI